jgi:hypothetical protein
MSVAWYWPDWGCSDPPEESCSNAGCPVHDEPLRFGLEAGTIECPMCGVERDQQCRSCGGCDCECVCGEDR